MFIYKKEIMRNRINLSLIRKTKMKIKHILWAHYSRACHIIMCISCQYMVLCCSMMLFSWCCNLLYIHIINTGSTFSGQFLRSLLYTNTIANCNIQRIAGVWMAPCAHIFNLTLKNEHNDLTVRNMFNLVSLTFLGKKKFSTKIGFTK